MSQLISAAPTASALFFFGTQAFSLFECFATPASSFIGGTLVPKSVQNSKVV
jgi:hypothetical protein